MESGAGPAGEFRSARRGIAANTKNALREFRNAQYGENPGTECR